MCSVDQNGPLFQLEKKLFVDQQTSYSHCACWRHPNNGKRLQLKVKLSRLLVAYKCVNEAEVTTTAATTTTKQPHRGRDTQPQ